MYNFSRIFVAAAITVVVSLLCEQALSMYSNQLDSSIDSKNRRPTAPPYSYFSRNKFVSGVDSEPDKKKDHPQSLSVPFRDNTGHKHRSFDGITGLGWLILRLPEGYLVLKADRKCCRDQGINRDPIPEPTYLGLLGISFLVISLIWRRKYSR